MVTCQTKPRGWISVPSGSAGLSPLPRLLRLSPMLWVVRMRTSGLSGKSLTPFAWAACQTTGVPQQLRTASPSPDRPPGHNNLPLLPRCDRTRGPGLKEKEKRGQWARSLHPGAGRIPAGRLPSSVRLGRCCAASGWGLGLRPWSVSHVGSLPAFQLCHLWTSS